MIAQASFLMRVLATKYTRQDDTPQQEKGKRQGLVRMEKDKDCTDKPYQQRSGAQYLEWL